MPPDFAMSSSVDSPPSSGSATTSAMTTAAPSAAKFTAIARPIPELAPVTMATFPASKLDIALIPSWNLTGLHMPDQHADRTTMQPDIKLAATLFDSLDRATRRGRGIVRDSYGDGEQAAHDIMRAAADHARPGGIRRCHRQPDDDAARPRSRRAAHHHRIASRQRSAERQLRRGGRGGGGPVRRCRRSSSAGTQAAVRHHGHGHSRRGIRLVRHCLSRQQRCLRFARSRLPRDHPIGQRQEPRGHADRARLRSATDPRAAAHCSTPRVSAPIWSCTSNRVRRWWPRSCRPPWSPASAAASDSATPAASGQYAHSGAVNRPHRHDAVAATVALLHHLETRLAAA